jgi:unsaturated rhamnogalacturonyl hydrolase
MGSATWSFGRLSITLVLTIGVACRTVGTMPAKHFDDWPEAAVPSVVGKRVAENIIARPFDYETTPRREHVIYPEVCSWYGALTIAKLSGDENLQSRLIKRFDPFLTPEGAKRISHAAHVDYRVFGAVPLEIFLQNENEACLRIGLGLADDQWRNPTADGITSEARYWIDDMYMISAVQVQAYRATGRAEYIDRPALAMVAYLDKLQQPNGLFYHASDSPFFWSRGCGWMAAGMTELLRALPKNHPRYQRVMRGYRTMMAALLRYQGQDGMWRQLVDKPEAWPESSGTGMFTYAIVTGVKNGWIEDAQYGPAARKAWLALVRHIDADANVTDVCIGTDKAYQIVGEDLVAQYKYYLARDRRAGDLHGQAPVLWTASAFLR